LKRAAIVLASAVSLALGISVVGTSARADTVASWTPQQLRETIVPGYTFTRIVAFTATRDLDSVTVSVPASLAPYVRAGPGQVTGIKKAQTAELSLVISAPSSARLRSVAGSIRLQPSGTSSSVSKPLPVSINISKPTVVVLSAHPTPAQLAAARGAFHAGHIVEMLDGTADDVNALLGLGVGRVQGRDRAPGAPGASAGALKVVAVRAASSGSLHQFHGFASGSAADAGTPQRDTVWQRPLKAWVAREQRRALGVADDVPPPPADAWTPLQEVTYQQSDIGNNVFQNTISVYRLNEDNTAFDWYMVLQDPTSQPNFSTMHCNFFLPECGWWTSSRTFTITTGPSFLLFDHGPTQQITSSTAGFNIGGSLVGPNPGVSVAYSTSWQQPSVTTTDQSSLSSGMAQWQESFQGEASPPSGAPPGTSISTFQSFQGAIFQVPEGTTGFDLNVDTSVSSTFQPEFGNPETAEMSYNAQLRVCPPVFSVSNSALPIALGKQGSLEVTAGVPSSSQGLGWVVTNVPSWLTVSQLGGSGSTRVTLSVAPNTAVNTTASLNFDTDPALAAPSVEQGPLTVQVTVAARPNTAASVLVTGGDTSGGTATSAADVYDTDAVTFTGVGSMTTPRQFHTATLLKTGQVLVAGGRDNGGSALASAELYDPTTGTFTPVNSTMATARSAHTATLLKSGQVLIAGGFDGSGNTLAAAELFNPATATFTAIGQMTAARGLHTATLLQNGDVLLAGGFGASTATDTAEIFNPATTVFTGVGSMADAREGHTASLLSSGQVLVAGGGNDALDVLATAELYNPVTGKFTSTDQMTTPRSGHTATTLPNGEALLAGGQDDAGNVLSSAELYNPSTGAFTPTGSMISPRHDFTATPLPGAQVLVAGGSTDLNGTQVIASAELYNTMTRSFGVTGPMTLPRTDHAAALLGQAP
jgi:hypothetical protein